MYIDGARHCALNFGAMIRSIEIERFRGFESLRSPKCGRVNVIVGDNGSGKTALLEAIFLALGASTELPLRFRQQRGLEGLFSGSTHSIEEAIYGDLFFNKDWSKIIKIDIEGTDVDKRSLWISEGHPKPVFPSLGTRKVAYHHLFHSYLLGETP
jgi:AAA15 family ATPase/GTPase